MMVQWKNSEAAYGALAKLLHWCMALLIIGMLALGLYMSGLALSPQKFKFYGLHKSFGILILGLVALRLLWRQMNTVPPLPADMKPLERFGAHASHFLLYAFMFGMPIVGWSMSSALGFPVSVFGLFTMPDFVSPDEAAGKLLQEWHYLGGLALIALILLHGGAALFHHFHRKDNVLKRMLP